MQHYLNHMLLFTLKNLYFQYFPFLTYLFYHFHCSAFLIYTPRTFFDNFSAFWPHVILITFLKVFYPWMILILFRHHIPMRSSSLSLRWLQYVHETRLSEVSIQCFHLFGVIIRFTRSDWRVSKLRSMIFRLSRQLLLVSSIHRLNILRRSRIRWNVVTKCPPNFNLMLN